MYCFFFFIKKKKKRKNLERARGERKEGGEREESNGL